MISDLQVRKLSHEYQQTGNICMSALKSGMHRETASKYLNNGTLPSQSKKKRSGRTRIDPFELIIDEIVILLKVDLKLEAKSLLGHLQDKYPNQYPDSVLRTLQRRLKELRRDLEEERAVMFTQEHHPGKMMQLDWTWCNELEITIQRQEFNHKLCHCVLTHSGWEWATICLSESYLSLVSGFQEAVFKLGKVPRVLQTDNSSSATHRIQKNKSERDFNKKYLSFLEHFDVEAQTTNVACPNENGTVESLNGHLKRRLNQALILRASRDFESQESYQVFLETVLNKANEPRLTKLTDELFMMQDAPPIRLPEYHEEICKVSKSSLVSLQKTVYSMPSVYIGSELRFRLFDQFIEVYEGRTALFTMPREVNRNARIDYRHIIHSLRRKPGAFNSYKYRQHLFPRFIFRTVYDRLSSLYNNRLADREYLDILHLAATEGEGKVSACLQDLISDKSIKLSLFELKKHMNLSSETKQQLTEFMPDLSSYDSLVGA